MSRSHPLCKKKNLTKPTSKFVQNSIAKQRSSLKSSMDFNKSTSLIQFGKFIIALQNIIVEGPGDW